MDLKQKRLREWNKATLERLAYGGEESKLEEAKAERVFELVYALNDEPPAPTQTTQGTTPQNKPR